MSQVYPKLEKTNQTSPDFMDGCFWFNCDLGFFGGEYGESMIHKYLEMVEILQDKPILLEKFHLTDLVYRKQHSRTVPDYSQVETSLLALDFGVVLTTFPENPSVLEKRLEDRMALYPHYQRVAKDPSFYIDQQALYREIVNQSALSHIEIELKDFSPEEVSKVLAWTEGYS